MLECYSLTIIKNFASKEEKDVSISSIQTLV